MVTEGGVRREGLAVIQDLGSLQCHRQRGCVIMMRVGSRMTKMLAGAVSDQEDAGTQGLTVGGRAKGRHRADGADGMGFKDKGTREKRERERERERDRRDACLGSSTPHLGRLRQRCMIRKPCLAPHCLHLLLVLLLAPRSSLLSNTWVFLFCSFLFVVRHHCPSFRDRTSDHYRPDQVVGAIDLELTSESERERKRKKPEIS